jgi:hypothetical protein
MGWLDDLQSRSQQQLAGLMQQVYDSLPPQAPRAFVDQVPLQGRPEEVMIAWYIGVVGLRPEDVYGILPLQSNDITVAIKLVYLDKPEYAAARARLAGTG